MTVPSPGITSPASTTTTSPRRQLVAALVPPSRQARGGLVRIARSVAACALPRPSAIASAKLPKSTVSHSQTATVNVNQPGWPASPDDPRADRGEQRADLDHEHDRVADHLARVELAQRVAQRRARRCRVEERALGPIGHRRLLVEARLSSSTLTDFAAEPEQRPSRVVVDQLEHALARQPARAATRLAWMRALASEMCGSTPEADVVAASAGMRAASGPACRALALQVGRRRSP